MQRRIATVLLAFIAIGCSGLGGCVVAPPRARVVAVVPGAVWVPAHWNHGGVWIAGHWRYP